MLNQELTALLASYREALVFWTHSLSGAATVAAANVADPVAELAKLARLIKAHTTKVGIIFRPENLAKDTAPAVATLKQLLEAVVLVVTVVTQLDAAVVSRLLVDDVVAHIGVLLAANVAFVDELTALAGASDAPEPTKPLADDEVDARLVSVGKIWANCDALAALADGGSLGLLAGKITDNVLLIDDGFDEFVEWAQNPEQYDIDDDPFGFSDDESDKDDTEPPAEPTTEATAASPSQQDVELAAFAQKWVGQIELVRLLLASFKKSLPATTAGATIDAVYTTQARLVALVDKFIVDLMLDHTVDDEITQYTKEMEREAKKLCRAATTAHRANDKKVKWYEAWETKFLTNGQ